MNHRSQRIELHGEYDLANKEALAALFGSLNANSPIVVDMTNVAYIDSTFLHAIADLRRHFRPHSVTLFGVSEHAKRLLRIMDFDRLFKIVDAQARPPAALSTRYSRS